jgi:hypothetical protein
LHLLSVFFLNFCRVKIVYMYLLIHACYRSSHLIFLRVTELRTFDESEKPYKTNGIVDWKSLIFLDHSFLRPWAGTA